MSGQANPLLRALVWSARRGSILLAVGIFGGVAFPRLASALQWFVTPNVLLMTTFVLLRVDLARTLAHLRRPARVGAIVLVQMVVCPVVVWGVVAPLGLDPGIAAGVVIFATGCAATSSAAFARLVGLDPDLSLLSTLAMLVVVPLTAPPMALWLLGVDLSIGPVAFMGRLVVVVGGPMLVSLALRRVIGGARLDRWGEAVDGALVWLVVVYGVAVMDGLAARMAVEPGWVVQALVAAFAVDYGLNALTTLVFARWGVVPAATAGLMSGNRNMALFIAVLPAGTDPRVLLFFGLCQFPLFLSPFLLRPAYRRLLRGPLTDARSPPSAPGG